MFHRPKALLRVFGRSRSRSGRSLRFESLETRTVFDGAGLGGAWNEASGLTISFPEDGTQVGSYRNTANDLFAEFGTKQWHDAVLRGFQVWAAKTSVNFGVVADDNSPLGSQPANRLLPGFGDIRIAAVPMSNEVLSISIPYDQTVAGTWSGDILFNSSAKFSSVDEIFRVTVHEAGHVLGLEHSDDPDSPMFAHGAADSVLPTADDFAALIAKYGERGPDRNELIESNDSLSKATKLDGDGESGFDSSKPAIEYGELSSTDDVDYFELKNLAGGDGPIEVRVTAKGLSKLSFSAQIVTEKGEVKRDAGIVAPGGSASLLLSGKELSQKRYLRIRSANHDDTNVGAYAVLQQSLDKVTVSEADIQRTIVQGHRLIAASPAQTLHLKLGRLFSDPQAVLEEDDGADDTVDSANRLQPIVRTSQVTKYQIIGSIAGPGDVDIYSVKSGTAFDSSKPLVMTVELESLDPNGLIGKLVIRDSVGNLITPETAYNDQGLLIVQFIGVAGRKTYQVTVEADASSPNTATGNYRLSARFDQSPSTLQTLTSAELTSESPQKEMTLYVAQTQLMEFGIRSAILSGAPSDGYAAIAIFDAAGKAIYYNTAALNDTRTSESLVVEPGEYRIVLAVDASKLNPDANVRVELFGDRLSRPLGPPVVDPNQRPIYTLPGRPGVFAYPDGTVTPSPTVFVPPVVPSLPPQLPFPIPPLDPWALPDFRRRILLAISKLP